MKSYTLYIVALVIVGFFSLGSAPDALAATMVLRTAPDTSIASINSIALVDSFATKPIDVGTLRATVFGLTFSITAFDTAISIPFTAGLHEPGKDPLKQAFIGYHFHSRFGTPRKPGKALVIAQILSDAKKVDDHAIIAPHTTGLITLLVAVADIPKPDRQDRLEISTLGLAFSSSTSPIVLNPSEVSKLKTPYVELYK